MPRRAPLAYACALSESLALPTTAVIVPVFNETRWLLPCVERLLRYHAPERLYIVDDGSTDGTDAIVQQLASARGVRTFVHAANRGKGAAVRTGIAAALEGKADIVLIHDADMEYDPADHNLLLAPILDGRADAVIGSRFIGHTHRVLYYWHSLANKFISQACSVATNLNLTDVECCSKAFRSDLLRGLVLREDRFGIEIELIAKAAKSRLADDRDPARSRRPRIYEVAVSYAGRTFDEGKKIRWTDGVDALRCILKYGL